MKKYLSIFIAAASLHVSATYACSEPKAAELAPLQMFLIKEQDPHMIPFLEHAFCSALQKIYEQNGCHTMSQMQLFHGQDECYRLYKSACQDAMKAYWQETVKQQSLEGNKYHSW